MAVLFGVNERGQRGPENNGDDDPRDEREGAVENTPYDKKRHHNGADLPECLDHQIDLHGGEIRVVHIDFPEGVLEEHEIFPEVAPGPADHHFTECDVTGGHFGIADRIFLKNDLPPFPEQDIGQCPVFRDDGRLAEEGLVDPFIDVWQQGGPAEGAERARLAEDRMEHTLGRLEELEAEDETDVQHPGDDAVFRVGNAHTSRHAADFFLCDEGGGDLPEGTGFHQCVAVQRHNDLRAGNEEPLADGVAFAGIFRQVECNDPLPCLFHGGIDPVPGIVPAAVVDGDDLQLVSGIIASQQVDQGLFHLFAFVECGHDHADRGQFIIAGIGITTVLMHQQDLPREVCHICHQHDQAEKDKDEQRDRRVCQIFRNDLAIEEKQYESRGKDQHDADF